MKKLTTSIVVITLYAMCAYSQDKTEAQHPLVGIWQMFIPVKADDGNRIIMQPIFKIIKNDGTYTVMAGEVVSTRINGNNVPNLPFVITQEGRYEIKNDSTYHEQIDKHYSNPLMEHTTSIINFSFGDTAKQFIHINVTSPATNFKGSEIWHRVTPAVIKN